MPDLDKVDLNEAVANKILADEAGELEILYEQQAIETHELERKRQWDEILSKPHRMENGIPILLTPEEIEQKEAEAQEAMEIRQLVKLSNIRTLRNQLLLNSDWTQLHDNLLTEEQRNEWRLYRKALRDITEGLTDLDAVVWPEQPQSTTGK